MSERRRVWITGIGPITAIGTGRDAFRAGLRAGRSRVRRIDRFDPTEFRSQVAAQIDDFDPQAWMPPKTARQLDRSAEIGDERGSDDLSSMLWSGAEGEEFRTRLAAAPPENRRKSAHTRCRQREQVDRR